MQHRKRLFAANYRKKMNSADVAVPFDAIFFSRNKRRIENERNIKIE